MANIKPSCPKCGRTQFEPTMYHAQESDEELTLVQCIACGTVVGVDIDPIRIQEWKQLIGRVETIETLLKQMQPPF